MNFAEKLSIVVPTHNRYECLKRLLAYYASFDFPFKILILDSSGKENPPQFLNQYLGHANVFYQKYDANLNYLIKIAEGLNVVGTPYAAICPDDDFLNPTGVAESVKFLEGHQDYVMAHGMYVSFHERGRKDKNGIPAISWKPLYFRQKTINDEDPSGRILHHMRSYHGTTFFAVHRVDVLRTSIIETINGAEDVEMHEIMPSALCSIYGKIAVLPVFYSARSDSGQMRGHVTGFSKEWRRSDKINRVMDCYAKHLMMVQKMSDSEARSCAHLAMNSYIDSVLEKNARMDWPFWKRNIKRALHKIGMGKPIKEIKTVLFGDTDEKTVLKFKKHYAKVLEREQSPFHEDFLNFRRALK